MVKRNAALGFIFITVLIDVIGFGIVIPVFPGLIAELTGKPVNLASQEGSWLQIAYAVMQFLFAPIMGGLSDKYGRRPVLLISLFAFGIDYLFLSFAPTFGLLFIGRVIAGITGATFTTAGAYIADITPPEKRAQNFGMLGAAFGLGFIIGPLVGGLFSTLGQRVPFMVAAGLCFLNALYGFFILPESLSKENHRPFSFKRANPLGSLLQLRRYPALSGLVASFFFIYLAAQAVQANWGFFVKYRFKWNEKLIGYSLAVVGLLIGLVQSLLIRATIPRFGVRMSAIIGIVLYTLGLSLFAFANETWMMFAFLVPYCLGGISTPGIQGAISGHVPPNEQGELQGALTSLMSVTFIIGPLIMNNLFTYFTTDKAPIFFPGAPFLMGALFMIVSLFLVIRTFNKHPDFAILPKKKDIPEAAAV